MDSEQNHTHEDGRSGHSEEKSSGLDGIYRPIHDFADVTKDSRLNDTKSVQPKLKVCQNVTHAVSVFPLKCICINSWNDSHFCGDLKPFLLIYNIQLCCKA